MVTIRALARASIWRRLAAVAVVLALVVAGVLLLMPNGRKHATVIFPSATSLYPGDDVRILGLKVGKVDRVQPVPDGVQVHISYDAEHKIPAEVKAAIISPALVASRYVELSPAYTGGPVLGDGETIPASRTAVPVEFDKIKEELNALAEALGPDGANSSGSLARLLETGEKFRGQGKDFHAAAGELASALETLSDGREDIFGTVRNLSVLVSALRASDDVIVEFMEKLDDVSGTLDENKSNLSTMIGKLDSAAKRVRTFISTHRDDLTKGTDQLAELVGVVAANRDHVAQALHVAPTVLSNAYNIYDPLSGAFTGSLQVPNLTNPALFVCSGIGAALKATPVRTGELCEEKLGPLLNLLRIDHPPVGINPIVRPGTPGSGVVRPEGPGTPGKQQKNQSDSDSAVPLPQTGGPAPKSLDELLSGRGAG